MDVTITILPLGGDEYRLSIAANGAGPLSIISNEVINGGQTRFIIARQNPEGQNPVETAPFHKLPSEEIIAVEIQNSEGEKIGAGEKQWD